MVEVVVEEMETVAAPVYKWYQWDHGYFVG